MKSSQMRSTSKLTTFLAMALGLSVVGIAQSSQAAIDTWSGGISGAWDTTTAGNWLDDGTGDTKFNAGNDAWFTAGFTNNVTTATGLNIGAITLDNTFTGSVTMSGGNTVNGATTISGGTLNLNNATGLGASAITVNSGGTLAINPGTANNTVANSISGNGLLTLQDPASGTNALTLSGSLGSFTGTVNILAGASSLGKVAFSTTSQANVMSSGTIQVQSGATLYIASPVNYGASIELFGNGNSENLGALRIEGGANWTGSVTLKGNSFIGSNSAATISGNIGENGGSFGFTKRGSNTLTLTGSNSYTGGTTIQVGTVAIGNGNALGTGTVTMGGGNLSSSAAVTLANNITANSNATFTGAGGTLALNGNINGSGLLTFVGTNKITLAGSNTLSNSISETAGNLEITGTTTIDGGSGSNLGYFGVTGNTTLTVSPGGLFKVLGTTNATKPNSIVGQNATGASELIVNGGTFLVGGNTGFALGNSVTATDRTGILTISSGTATINAGSATLQNQLNFIALGRDNATGIVNLNAGVLETGRQFVRDGSGGGTAGLGTATFNFNGGTLRALASQTGGNGWFETATTGNFQVVTTNVKEGGAIIDTNGFNTNINTVLAHGGVAATDGGLTKTGLGTLTLGAANTYTGATNVNNGTLAVGSGASITGTVVLGKVGVSTGTLDVTSKASYSLADLSGNGTVNIGTTKTVTATGAVAPGFGVGTLNVTGGFTLQGTTAMEIAGSNGVAGTDFDLVSVTEAVTFGGSLSIASLGGYDLNTPSKSYQLFSAGSFAGNFTSVSVGGTPLTYDAPSDSWSGGNFTFNEATGTLVVPEPTSAMMLLGGIGMLGILRRRRH